MAALFCMVAMLVAHTSYAEEELGYDQHLAEQLVNPVASLVRVSLELDYDSDIGPADNGRRFTINVRPVIPFSLSQDWNVISRTIMPIVDQEDVPPDDGSQFGLSDIEQSLFFSPKQPTASGIIWGVGPVFLFPTATDDPLGTGKWGLGPTGAVLRQKGPWTYGALTNHIWSVGGDGGRSDVNVTLLQPFIDYTTESAWTFTLQSETTYDWDTHQEADKWSVPINVAVSKLLKFGGQEVNIGSGVRYWAASPDSDGPGGVGFQFGVTFLFPK